MRKDDLIISARGTVGAMAQLVKPMTFNQSCYGLRGNERINNDYLFYALKSGIEQFKDNSYGAIFGAITVKSFDLIKIPLPPKDVQEKIVAEIEVLEVEDTKAKAEIQNLKDRVQEISADYFSQTNLFVKIREIAESVQYGISEAMNLQKVGFKIFRMNEIIKGKMFDNGNMKHAHISSDEFQKFKLNKGDILFNRTNSIELVGKTGIFNLDGDYCFASYLIRLKVNEEKAHPIFVNMLINSTIFQAKAKESAIKAINQANINAEKLKNFQIPLPPLKEQQKIVSQITEIENKIAALENEIATIPQQKEAILKKYL